MALTADFYHPIYNITISNCYWKIDPRAGLEGGKERLSVKIICYKDKANADINSNQFWTLAFTFVPDLGSSDNFLAQAYAQAKAILPELAGASDVLD